MLIKYIITALLFQYLDEKLKIQLTLTHLIIASASATAKLHCNWKSRGDAAIYLARNGFKSIMEAKKDF